MRMMSLKLLYGQALTLAFEFLASKAGLGTANASLTRALSMCKMFTEPGRIQIPDEAAAEQAHEVLPTGTSSSGC